MPAASATLSGRSPPAATSVVPAGRAARFAATSAHGNEAPVPPRAAVLKPSSRSASTTPAPFSPERVRTARVARPSLALRWLMLAGAVALAAGILASGALDGVSVMREYATRRDLFLREAHAHLALAFGSLGLALLIGIPTGIAIFQARRWRGPVLGVLNILQTIPSLALFGIMIPIFGWVAATLPGAAKLGVSGIGTFPALMALFLYSLLPVVSNTLAGLSGVPAATREAAVGLGMTRAQVLAQVLVPLALPVLLAAVRIVLVQNIGLAVIAGLIGGGGFGTFVFQGLNQTAMDLVLLGALPTIALALVAGIALDLVVQGTRRRAA